VIDPVDVGSGARELARSGRSNRLVRLAPAVLIACLGPLLFAPAANAGPTATVKAKTQRMTDANLSSQQDGWYNPGDHLTLVCSKQGEPVKGFFSFNIPGGWDNLWYKTSDGHFVADVDIETGTLKDVTNDCGTQQQAPAAPAAPQSNGLRWPLDSVNVVQGFGADPNFYRQFGQNGHNGLDLAAAPGTPVYAANDGTVEFEGDGQNNSWMRSEAGICILIKHSNVYTGYAHLSDTVINKGQHVSKGQLIGHSGATGVATGPHLHFEVLPLNPDFKNGFAGRVDPGPYLG
jgi:murein DD-endopeptidase MepM/ murein hydrolase activator NlpD